MHRFNRSLKPALVAAAGVATALAVAGLTQAAPGGGYSASTTPTTTTTTTETTTTPTKTVTTPAKPAPKATTKDVTCRSTLIAVITPIDNAENFGKLKCSAPFGKGVQNDSSKITRSSQTAGSFAGSFKHFFNTGTLRGTFKMAFTVTAGKASYDGTMKVTSGTGEYAGVKGSGTIVGASDDLVHTPVTEKLTLTIPPAKK